MGYYGDGSCSDKDIKDDSDDKSNVVTSLVDPDGILEDLEIPYDQLQIVEQIGEGAYSEVFLANYKESLVAVKRLRMPYQANTLKDFIKELNSLRKVEENPHFLKLIGACTEPYYCVVTELMPWGSLHDCIHVKGKIFPLDHMLRIAESIAEGMVFLHSINVVHRDLTSMNVLLDEEGDVKIGDLGISRIKHGKGKQSMTPTGHPRWRAPEICRKEPYGKRVDVYQFGLLLWELLTSEKPFAEFCDKEVPIVVAKGMQLQIPDHFPKDLQKLVKKCVNQHSCNRPSFKVILSTLQAISKKLKKQKVYSL